MIKIGDRVFKIGGKSFVARRIADSPYYVSKCGEIISIKTPNPKRLVGSISFGYRRVILCSGGTKNGVSIHHMVMRWWVGKRPPGMVINHKNGIKGDNRLSNLEYCTPRQNRDHAIVNRLYSSGERCSWSKLNEESVDLIRRAKKLGMPNGHLARAFMVSVKSIQQVLKGATWKYSNDRRG